jgi:hypothetical protein
MKNLSVIALTLLILLASTGCAAQRQWGSPRPVGDPKKDLAELIEQLKDDLPVSRFTANPTKEQRNKYIGARMTLITIRYFEFVDELTRNKQMLDAGSDILVLTLNLAGATLTPASTKTVLAAISAGVTGSKAVVDRTFFYEKTVGALVAQMNANRAEIATRIFARTDQPLSEYTFQQAFTDVNEFENAGKLATAVQMIQAQAASQERQAIDKLQKLQLLSPDERTLKRNLTRAIGQLKPADLPKIQAALTSLGVASPPADFPAARRALQDQVLNAGDAEAVQRVAEQFRQANITVPQ